MGAQFEVKAQCEEIHLIELPMRHIVDHWNKTFGLKLHHCTDLEAEVCALSNKETVCAVQIEYRKEEAQSGGYSKGYVLHTYDSRDYVHKANLIH